MKFKIVFDYHKIMKKNLQLTFILFLLGPSALMAQQEYLTECNIHYYSDSVQAKDEYLASQCTLDIYYPTNTKNFPAIIWFHGGSLTGGKKQIPEALKNKGYAVIGVEYRLSPKAKAPAYIEDAAAAVAWVFNHIEKYGGRKNLIFVSGHSAGGYLGMMVTLDKTYLARYHLDSNSIAALVPFSGQAITHFTIRKENGIENTKPIVDKYAPLFFVRADAPRMLLITGDREQELLGRYEENAYMARMMKLAGHSKTTLYELQGFNHGGMAEPAFPLLLKEVGTVTKEVLEKK